MQSIGRIRNVTLAVLVVLATVALAAAQAGFEDDRVMLQGFYWESYRHGHPQRFPTFGTKTWYRLVREKRGHDSRGAVRSDLAAAPVIRGGVQRRLQPPRSISGWTIATGLSRSTGRCSKRCSRMAPSPSRTS